MRGGPWPLKFSSENATEQCSRAPGWLFYIEDIRPTYMGIVINHHKDPYETASIMERQPRVFFVAQLVWVHDMKS